MSLSIAGGIYSVLLFGVVSAFIWFYVEEFRREGAPRKGAWGGMKLACLLYPLVLGTWFATTSARPLPLPLFWKGYLVATAAWVVRALLNPRQFSVRHSLAGQLRQSPVLFSIVIMAILAFLAPAVVILVLHAF